MVTEGLIGSNKADEEETETKQDFDQAISIVEVLYDAQREEDSNIRSKEREEALVNIGSW